MTENLIENLYQKIETIICTTKDLSEVERRGLSAAVNVAMYDYYYEKGDE